MYFCIISYLLGILHATRPDSITYGNYQYWIVDDRVTQPFAKRKCGNLSGSLVVIYNETVQEMLAEKLIERNKTFSFWIGLERMASNHNFVWVDKTPLTYDNWIRDEEPNCTLESNNCANMENCVAMGFPRPPEVFYKWFTFNCNGPSGYENPGYICQRKIIPTTTPFPYRCTADGTPCVFPFTYGNVKYTSCTTIANNNVPWCSTTSVYRREWGNCAECPYVPTTTPFPYRCTADGTPCVFPFTYENVKYTSCTTIENGNVPWCSTTRVYDGEWGNCAECPYAYTSYAEEPNHATQTTNNALLQKTTKSTNTYTSYAEEPTHATQTTNNALLQTTTKSTNIYASNTRELNGATQITITAFLHKTDKSASTMDHTSSNLMAIIIPIVVGFLLVILFTIILFIYFKKKKFANATESVEMNQTLPKNDASYEMNSYEVVDLPLNKAKGDRQMTDNEIYQPSQETQNRQIVYNEIYQSSQESKYRQIIDNEIYQSNQESKRPEDTSDGVYKSLDHLNHQTRNNDYDLFERK